MGMPGAVLVVDDDSGCLLLAVRMLEWLGVQRIGQAANAVEAKREIATGGYDVVLMDISMPGMSGVELCQLVRLLPAARHMAIHACTAHAGRADKTWLKSEGFDSVLTKPFLLEDLTRVLEMKGRAAPAVT